MKEPLAGEVLAAKAGTVEVRRTASMRSERVVFLLRLCAREENRYALNEKLEVASVYIEGVVLGYRPEICVSSMAFPKA